MTITDYVELVKAALYCAIAGAVLGAINLTLLIGMCVHFGWRLFQPPPPGEPPDDLPYSSVYRRR